MADYPPGWDLARSQNENDSNDDEPEICRLCAVEDCERDPRDCEADAEADAIDRAYEAWGEL